MPRMKVRKGKASPMVMHKPEMIRKLQSRLKFLLDFLNVDVESLNSVELLKLFLDFGVFIYGRRYFEEIERMDFKPKKGLVREKRFLNVCQDYLRFLLDGFLGVQESDDQSYSKLETITVSYYVFMTNDKIYKLPFLPQFRYLAADLPKHLHEDSEMGNIYRGILSDEFVRTVNPFPISRIKICQRPDCGNYFFQKTTKSKGDFCSTKCQNFARAQRYRENHRNEYNAYYRNRRAKAKEPWIKMTCLNCGHEYPTGHPDLGVCSKCEGKLKYEVQFLEDREWKSEQCQNFKDAEQFRKEILEYEKSGGKI